VETIRYFALILSRRIKVPGSESLLVGRDFGVTTDIETGPNGNLFVVSLSQGTIYEIFRRQAGSHSIKVRLGNGTTD
jgi:hypothetical protein